ncbi:MAG: SDR family NAD(P)-dependent oxidoreductase [Gammaproteobacteria bacterium]
MIRSGWKRTWVALLAIGLGELTLAGQAHAETVMITGANSGIGLEFATQYAAKGWTVIVTHRRKEPPQTLADLDAKYPGKIRIESLDVTNVEQVRALATRMANTPIDVLINNAGVYNDRRNCKAEDEGCPGDWTTQTLGKLDYALLDTIMSVNIKGPLLVTESFLPNVKASGLKKIVAISSSNGTITGEKPVRPGTIYYRMSKAALNREMQIVAASLKDAGITVLMLNPGPTLTEHQAYLKENPTMLKTSFTVGNMIKTIDKSTVKDTGQFLRYDGVPEAW